LCALDTSAGMFIEGKHNRNIILDLNLGDSYMASGMEVAFQLKLPVCL
jgi:hypothetical protein